MELIYLSPLFGALVGWITNHLAVRMLFWPRRPTKFLFFTLQGIFPKRQALLAKKLGHVVATELFSAKDLKEVLDAAASSSRLSGAIDRRLDELISSKLEKVLPDAVSFIAPQISKAIRSALIQDIEAAAGPILKEISSGIGDELGIEKLVENKIASYSSERLEELLISVMRTEFRFIEMLGAIIGFMIGLAQLAIFSF